MTRLILALYGLIAILCSTTCAYEQCFNKDQNSTVEVSVAELYERMAVFGPTIFKAAIYITSDTNKSNSVTNLPNNLLLGMLSAYFRDHKNIPKSTTKEPSVILPIDVSQQEKGIFNGIVQSNSVDNILISPISIWFFLMQAYFGARRATSYELAKVLKISDFDKNAVGVAYQQLKSEIQNVSDRADALKIVNKFYIFGRPIYHCVNEFFGSDIERLDRYDHTYSTNKINAWTREQTNGKIPTFLPEGVVYYRTHFILANAACFKGKWAKQFDARKTTKENFFQNALRVTSLGAVDMMKAEHNFPYAKSSTLHCTAVELMYESNEISMLALLPHEDNSAEYLAGSLTKTNLDQLYANMQARQINLHFPKFRIDQRVVLDHMLISLGLKGLFIQGVSDLTGYNGNDELHFADVQHDAFIEVDEEGVQPAFSSAAQHLEPYIIEQDPIIQFNHPFVFVIRHKKSNSILFMGLVRKPSM